MGQDDELKQQDDRARLWPIGRALTLAGTITAAGLAVVTLVALALLGFPRLQYKSPLPVADLLDVLKLVLGTVAGVGALFALVMAYRRQRVAEFTEAREQARAVDERTRVFNERFATAAEQIGHTDPAVRLAGVYAMAGLADDWEHGRQTCIDVLCAYLRMPYEPQPVGDARAAELVTFGRDQEVRLTVIGIIAAHLRPNAAVSWQGRNFNLSRANFDGGNFDGAIFSSGTVSFFGAKFTGELVTFKGAKFTGGAIHFHGAKFAGHVAFDNTEFTGGTISFHGAEVADGGNISFTDAKFSGGVVDFSATEFTGGYLRLHRAKIAGGKVAFHGAKILDGNITFGGARFSGGVVDFGQMRFAGGSVRFRGARFAGSGVTFAGARFGGGKVDLQSAAVWEVPPAFDDAVDPADPPEGLLLPTG